MPKPRPRSALSTDLDPWLLEKMQAQAKHEGVSLRTVVEKALALYLNSDGLPPAIGSSIEKTRADIAILADQIEPIAAFLASMRYRDRAIPRRGMMAWHDDDEAS